MFNVYESTSSYTFDLGDRITQIVDSIAGTTVRQYDGLDDLTDEQTAQGEVGYLYDNARRRQTMTVVGQPTVSYSWDNAEPADRNHPGQRVDSDRHMTTRTAGAR